jgi:hypothetical protein
MFVRKSRIPVSAQTSDRTELCSGLISDGCMARIQESLVESRTISPHVQGTVNRGK